MQVENATPRVGSIVTMDREEFLAGTHARALQELLVERSALVFRDMHLSEEEQLRFARTIGDVFAVGGRETQNITMDKAINPVADYTRGAFNWHIDGASDPVPAKATMLSVVIPPDEGEGDTLVANTYAAYDDLPDEDKAALAGVRVRHSLEASQRLVNPTPTVAELSAWQARPTQIHPLVWHHGHGRASLLLGATCLAVEGMDIQRGSMLLCRLMEWATQPHYVYRHRWRAGDFLLWDNTGTMHRAADYRLDSDRRMLRTTLNGEEPIN